MRKASNVSVRSSFATFAIGVLVLATQAPGRAQLSRVRADLTPLVESETVATGSDLRAALRIRLPEGYHVNSNKPRDELLIPTELTVQPPAGVSVSEIVYPASTDLKQRGADQPLSVFEREFTIGVAMHVAAGTAPGDLAIPARLHRSEEHTSELQSR